MQAIHLYSNQNWYCIRPMTVPNLPLTNTQQEKILGVRPLGPYKVGIHDPWMLESHFTASTCSANVFPHKIQVVTKHLL